MSLFERVGGLFGGQSRKDERPPAPVSRRTISTAPREAVNDAQGYGVTIAPAPVAPGAWYWQAVRVHHLSSEENGGNHHIFLDLLDSATPTDAGPLGGRVSGARARITWDGGEQIVTVDKPPNEPGTNFPLWKWQVCTVQALGLPGEELPSDRVAGMHTGHPDEGAGNTLFHHSFAVTFLKVRTPDAVYTDSALYGVIRHGAGRTASLVSNGGIVASQVIGPNGAFRFTDLGAGEYVVVVEGTSLRSEPVRVNGRDQSQIELTLASAESAITGRVRNGAGRMLSLLRDGAEVAVQAVAPDESYRFAGLPAGAFRVALAGTRVVSPVVSLDGVGSASEDLVAPAPGKLLAHYVLFGPRDRPATRAHLLLAQEYLLAFRPAFGFSPEEARGAGLVTIIAGADAVSAQVEADLAADGIPVQRVAGSAAEVAAALAERVGSGKLF